MIAANISFDRLLQKNAEIKQSIEMLAFNARLQVNINIAEVAYHNFLITAGDQYAQSYQIAVKNITNALQDIDLKKLNFNNSQKQIQLIQLIFSKISDMNLIFSLDTSFSSNGLVLPKTILTYPKIQLINQIINELQLERTLWINENDLQWRRFLFMARFSLIVFALIVVLMILIAAIKALAQISLQDKLMFEVNHHCIVLENEVIQQTQELSELARSLQKVQEEERAFLARELHDEMGSILIASKMLISMVIRKMKVPLVEISREDINIQLLKVMRILDDGVMIKRRLIEGLRPSTLIHLGLAVTLKNHVEEMCSHAKIDCIVDINNIDKLSDMANIALYRILQESLTNTMKYAQATKVHVQLLQTETLLTLIIQDNGCGFDMTKNSKIKKHGLLGMKQRACALNGILSVISKQNEGTIIKLIVPLVDLI